MAMHTPDNLKDYVMKKIRKYVKEHKEILSDFGTEEERYRHTKTRLSGMIPAYRDADPMEKADYNKYIILRLVKEGLSEPGETMGIKHEKSFHITMTMNDGRFRNYEHYKAESKAHALIKLGESLKHSNDEVLSITIVEAKRLDV